MLALDNVTKQFDGPDGVVRALVDFSLRVERGKFIAVQGPSGCGKTTLLFTAGALLAPEGGEVRIDDVNPYHLAPDRRARLRAEKIGFVFQQFYLIPYLNVLDNILAPSIAIPCPQAAERARELIGHFNLESRINHVPAELSTGERQRVALARALLNRPGLLLADEPTGNLDRENARIVLGYIAEFAEAGGAVLLVTHDPFAAEFAGQIIHMEQQPVASP